MNSCSYLIYGHACQQNDPQNELMYVVIHQKHNLNVKYDKLTI